MNADNLTALNNEAWTAQYVIGQLAISRSDVEHIAVVCQFKDGRTGTMTSKMPVEKLALLSKRLDLRVMDTLDEGRE